MSDKKDMAHIVSMVGLVVIIITLVGFTFFALVYGDAGVFSTEEKTSVLRGAMVMLVVGLILFIGGQVRIRFRR